MFWYPSSHFAPGPHRPHVHLELLSQPHNERSRTPQVSRDELHHQHVDQRVQLLLGQLPEHLVRLHVLDVVELRRATGITAYLDNGGTVENAQAIAGHESPRTIKLYDRTDNSLSLDEIERIAI